MDFSSTSGNGNFDIVSVKKIESVTTSGDITIVLNGSGASVVTKGVSSELFTEIEHKKSGKAYVFGDGKADIRLVSTSRDMYIK